MSFVPQHHDELDEVQRRFSAVPLFGTDLSRELANFEQQQQRSASQNYLHQNSQHQHQYQPRGGYDSVGRGSSPSASVQPHGGQQYNNAHGHLLAGTPAANTASAQLAAQRRAYTPSTPANMFNRNAANTYVMPPPPKRPWSVEQLFRSDQRATDPHAYEQVHEASQQVDGGFHVDEMLRIHEQVRDATAQRGRRRNEVVAEQPSDDAQLLQGREEQMQQQQPVVSQDEMVQQHEQQQQQQQHYQEEDDDRRRSRRSGSRTPSRRSRRRPPGNRVASHYSDRAQAAIPPEPSSSEADEPEDGDVIATLRREHAKAEAQKAEEERLAMKALEENVDVTGLLDEQGRLQTGERMNDSKLDKKLDLETVSVHIEKAAARRSMQKERLDRLGEQQPGEKVEGGCQTDDFLMGSLHTGVETATEPTPSQSQGRETAETGVGGPSPPNRSASSIPSASTGHHPSNKTPPVDILLQPSVPYRPVQGASEQQRRIEDLAKVYGWSNPHSFDATGSTKPAPNDGASQPTLNPFGMSGGPVGNASTTTPPFGGKSTSGFMEQMPAGPAEAIEAGPTERSGSATSMLQRSAAPQASLPSASNFLNQLDQLQLANEELLVRNKAFDKPSVLTPEENAFRASTMAHVGAANKTQPKVSFNAPIGGYGSFSDGTNNLPQTSQAQGSMVTMEAPSSLSNPSQTEEARWRAAHNRNENEGVTDSASGEPLRKWAANNLSTSLSNPSIKHTPSKSSLRTDNYSARKKWSNVSFALPHDAQTESGFLENLSGSARSLMQH